MTILKERLEEAIKSKENDVRSFIWKGKKEEVNGEVIQTSIRMIDASEKELNDWYAHCKSMLYNQDKMYPGRYVLLSIIKDQIERCNCELFLRWLEQDRGKPRFHFISDIRTVLDNNKDVITDTKTLPISTVVGGCPNEFKDLPISLVMDGCLDRLGKFSKQHLTLTFILKQGLWFTPQEIKEVTIKNPDGTTRDRVDVVREQLGLKPSINIYITPKGLNLAQLRAMVLLKSKKYSELTIDQLKTLRNPVLFALGDEARFHITQWETRMHQIEMAAEANGYVLEK